MPRNPQQNFVKAWRVHRRLTQAKLAEAVGTTGAVIGLVERGERRLSDKWAHRISTALQTRAGFLFDTDPQDLQD